MNPIARPRTLAAVVTAALGVTLAAAAPSVAAPERSVELSPLGTHRTGQFDESAAEIVKYHPASERLFTVNAQSGAIDVIDASDPSAPERVAELDMAGLQAADGSTVDDGDVNSIDIHGNTMAVAIQNSDKVEHGWVATFRLDRSGDAHFLSAVRVGSLPDMLTFTPDGRHLLVANEGEPADDFSTDPEGSVSVIRMTGKPGALDQSDVRTARFTAFEGSALPKGVRVFGPDVAVPEGHPAAGRVARNLEPEYIAVDRTGRTAYVALQENNTYAKIDVSSATVTDLMPLGLKDWSAAGNTAGFDASNKDDTIDIRNHPVKGMYMPDAIETYAVKGKTYIVSANEGDAREWGDYAETTSVEDVELCADVFPDAKKLQKKGNLGKLEISAEDGVRAGEGCHEEIHAYGGRSFSIWSADGDLVFDSGSQFEQLLAEGVGGIDPDVAFNANNDDNDSFDNRSDNKGPEPEGVTLGEMNGRTYAFVGLERVGGVMVYDITDPKNATFVDYVNNRNFVDADGNPIDADSAAAGDLGPEGLTFVPKSQSPTGRAMLVVANEVSGTTTLFDVALGRK